MYKYSLLLFVFISIFLSSCNHQSGNTKSKKLIVCTTGMIADATKNIVKDKMDVIALMGPGVDPHLYKATPGDLSKLQKADLIFYNGLHLEGKMGEIFEKLAQKKMVYAISDEIPETKLRKLGEWKLYDPHIWFDVALWKFAVQLITNKVSDADTINKKYYDTNSDTFITRLDELHGWVLSEISTIHRDQRVLVTAHDAFGYFGDAYHIEVRGLQGISTLSEFGLKDVNDMVNFISEQKIKAIFVESSVPEKSIKAVQEGCQKKGHQVKVGGTLFSDAMGDENTPEGTYIGMVTYNVNVIVKSLK